MKKIFLAIANNLCYYSQAQTNAQLKKNRWTVMEFESCY